MSATTAIAAVPAAAQTFSASTYARVETSSPGSVVLADPEGASGASPVASTSQLDRAAPNQSASVLTSAAAGAGALHVYATGKAVNDEPAGTQSAAYSIGSADAASSDGFLFLADGYSQGTLAYITANVYLDGDPFQHEGFGTYGYAQSWSASVGAGSNGGGGTWSGFDSNYVVCPACSNGGTLGLHSIGFYAVIGYENNVSMSLHVDNTLFMNMGEPGSVTGTLDLSNTFSWAGITSVSVNGVAVTDFSAISGATGFDYAKAYAEPSSVPEPASWALLVAGFGLVGGAARQRNGKALHRS
jgi:hypothetical protein